MGAGTAVRRPVRFDLRMHASERELLRELQERERRPASAVVRDLIREAAARRCEVGALGYASRYRGLEEPPLEAA